jgi:L-fucose isomerase-like protein
MEKIRVKLLAFPAADLQVYSRAKKRMQSLFHPDRVEFVDKDPEVLVFLTGGSERVALQSVKEFGFYLLIASADDNSWAAAIEVRAWMAQNNISSLLLDSSSPDAQSFVNDFYRVKNGLKRLKGQRFGIIGEPSEWLLSSVVDPFVIETKFGVTQENIPWDSVNISPNQHVGADFMSFFKTDSSDLKMAGKIYETFSKLIGKYGLQAVTVECFTLVGKCNSTACLALSKLAMDGIPAGCEGDTCSIIGLMISKEIFGIVPWMANISQVGKGRVTFAHCTTPGNLLKDFEVDTHFETGKGLALKGTLRAEEVTIFRFNNTLTKMFVGQGKVVEAPYSKNMCRTQVTLEVSPAVIDYFLNEAIGNHHLILPGNYVHSLVLLSKMLKIDLVGK